VRAVSRVVFVFIFAFIAAIAGAQSYPSKPVRVIVPFPPGAGVDIVTRIFTPKLAEALGQQFIVDNRSGAAGHIGAEIAARAAPDGYTLLLAPSSIVISQTLYPKLTYNIEKDLEPITPVAAAPFVLVVHPSLPVRNVKELIAFAKSKPGQLFYASGQVSLMFANTLSVLPFVQSGRLRALALSSAKRSAAVPELPTVAESGIPGFDVSTWFGLFAPAGTPREIINRLNGEVRRIGQMPNIRELLRSQGADPLSTIPEEFRAFIRAELVNWAKAVQAAGVRTE
jgi:tripartite-type tricarboxylate transporter receptor subunit TctC